MVVFGKVELFTGLRRMVYAVSPNETSFAASRHVPEYIDDSTPFFFLFMATEIIISLLKQDGKFRLNDSFTSISAGMVSRLPRIVLGSITIDGYEWVYRSCCIKELPWESPWTWWLTFIGVDMGYYWFHRMAHEVNFMWALHQTHHSSEDYNFSTALRQSALQVYTSWVFYLPMALFVPPAVFLAHAELNILYQFWIHTQYIRSLGPLEYILNTPSHHRVHHGRNPYCIDKNYAGTLIIWDRLFGTFEAEKEEVAFGLTHPINTFEPFEIQFGYCKYLVGRTFSFKGLTDKLKNFLYGPGWLPGKPRTGDIDDIPKIEQPVKLYNLVLPSWLTIYVLVHFFLFFLGYQTLIENKAFLSLGSLLVFIGYSLFNLTCFGRLFDNKPSAKLLELIRCVIFILGEIAICQLGFYGNKGERPAFMYVFQAIFTASSMIWIIQIMMTTQQNKMKQKVKSS